MKTSWMTVAQMRLLVWLGAIAFVLTSCSEKNVAGGTEAESTIALYVQMARLLLRRVFAFCRISTFLAALRKMLGTKQMRMGKSRLKSVTAAIPLKRVT